MMCVDCISSFGGYYMVQEVSTYNTFYMYGCIEYVQVGNSWKCAENKRNLLSVDNGICIHAAVAYKQFLYPFPSLVLIFWVFGLSTGIIVLMDLTDSVLVLNKYNNTTWHRQQMLWCDTGINFLSTVDGCICCIGILLITMLILNIDNACSWKRRSSR